MAQHCTPTGASYCYHGLFPNSFQTFVLEYVHFHSHVKACWGQMLQASHNPVIQPTVLYRNQHRKSMRSVCAPTKGKHMRSKYHLWRTLRSSNAKVRPESYQVVCISFFRAYTLIHCWKQHIRISCSSSYRWSLNVVKYHKCHQLLSECFFLAFHCGKNRCALMAEEVLSCPPFSWPCCV